MADGKPDITCKKCDSVIAYWSIDCFGREYYRRTDNAVDNNNELCIYCEYENRTGIEAKRKVTDERLRFVR